MIAHVTRADDPRLQHYRHVGDPAWLEAQGLFVAEGRLVLERLIEYGRFAVDSVLLTEAAFRAIEPRLDPSWLVLVADPAIVDGVTGFKFHRGCLALVHRPRGASPLSAFARARRLILLEAVGNPDNIGGIFRSAAALGADGVLLDPTCADPFYRKAVRTSMGAVLRLPFTTIDSWPQGLAALGDMGFTIVALDAVGGVDRRPVRCHAVSRCEPGAARGFGRIGTDAPRPYLRRTRPSGFRLTRAATHSTSWWLSRSRCRGLVSGSASRSRVRL